MPPKKAQRAAAAIGQKQKQTTEEEQNKKHEEEKPFANDKAYAEVKEPSPRKRKTPPTKAAKLYKEPRRATKSSSRGKSAPTQHQLVRFLLSPSPRNTPPRPHPILARSSISLPRLCCQSRCHTPWACDQLALFLIPLSV
jgi:hypothetical protein